MPRVPDDAPDLVESERQRVEKVARAAAEAAQARKAMTYLPFPDLPDAQRMVATWLHLLHDLFKFYDSQVKPSNRTVQVFRSGRSRGSEMRVGMCHGRTFEEFVRGLTRAFCVNRETDEIHELIAIKWILRVSTGRPRPYEESRGWRDRRRKDPDEYINEAQRGARKETPEQIAIKTAEGRGGKAERKCREVYDAVFHRVWQEEEDKIRSDRNRNKRVAAQIAKEEAKQERRSSKK